MICHIMSQIVLLDILAKTREEHPRASDRNTVRIRLMRATHHVT